MQVINPAVRIHVQEVQRMGRLGEGTGNRCVRVVVGSASEAEAVLRPARNLKEYKLEHKTAGNDQWALISPSRRKS